VMKGDDKAAIDEKVQALGTAAQKLGEKVYADQAKAQGDGAAGGPQGQPGGGAAPGAGGGGGGQPQEKEVEGNVVDAEYTEVKDKKSA
jgi:molecular chaperone DnaK